MMSADRASRRGEETEGFVTDALALQRRFFAEEIEAVACLRTPALVDALATVPREAFLPPGPWKVASQGDFQTGLRSLEGLRITPDADPRHTYHNISVAIDPARQLFNGQPALVCSWIEMIGLRPGSRVLHIGCGRGYYAALMGQVVGEQGRVVAVEVDRDLAERAAAALAPWKSVEVRHGDGTVDLRQGSFDAILVNAGVTHPEPSWLDALSNGGRLLLPLTVSIPGMGTLSKGPVLLLSNDGERDSLGVRVVGFAAIYSAVGLRDDDLNRRLGEAMKTGPFPPVARLRRDAHDKAPGCWLHADAFCLSA
jgi:protein-L-isoaspartate(D-aspartate) O-methyltransferase